MDECARESFAGAGELYGRRGKTRAKQPFSFALTINAFVPVATNVLPRLLQLQLQLKLEFEIKLKDLFKLQLELELEIKESVSFSLKRKWA